MWSHPSSPALKGSSRGKVVAPGFIDLLSYEPDDYGAWFKIGDGVTTNLGMHGINARPRTSSTRTTGRCLVHFGGAFDNPWMRTFGLKVRPGSLAAPDRPDAAQVEQSFATAGSA